MHVSIEKDMTNVKMILCHRLIMVLPGIVSPILVCI